MKNIFNKMDEDKIYMSADIDFQVSTNRIKQLTMTKVKSRTKNDFIKKSIGIAVSFLLIFTVTGITTYTLAGPVLKSYIQEILGIGIGEVLLVGESISNGHYTMTVEDFVYDGANGKATVSVSALSKTAKESFKTDKIYDKFGHFSIGYSIRELNEYQEDNKRYFSISFSKPLEKYDYLSAIDSLVFAFEGIRDRIRIPLEPTLSSKQKDIFIPAQGYYPVEYTSIVYSKLGFTLIGEVINENEDFSNITIDIILENGQVINFINTINYNYKPHNSNPDTNAKNPETHKETIIMDGQKIEIDVAKNESAKDTSIMDGVNFIHEINDEWFSGSGGSGYSTDNHLTEISFTFQKSFDLETVDKMIINQTDITFN